PRPWWMLKVATVTSRILGRIDRRSCDHGWVDPTIQKPGEAPVIEQDTTEYCYGHPKIATKLRCSRCDRPICGSCAIPASVGQHCPECVAEARRSAPKVRSAIRANAPAVTTILAINIGMFFLQFFPGVTEALVLDPFAIAQGQWYRLITAVFLHGGLLHLLFNSYVRYMLGPNVEQAFGTARFVVMYLVAGLMGSAFSFAIPPDNRSLGASGAIFGLAGVLLVYLYQRRRSTFVAEYLRNIMFFIVANLVLGFTLLAGVVDNLAHIGGLVAGILLGLGFDRRGTAIKGVTELLAASGVAAVAIALVVLRTTGAIF
ncbi:MAG: rhomboid family intramembrane serine protease, partial [Actinomycetota bacterium]|nr:rhomboid family intramembrane serine protease [Actinomycetota bacterium]